MKKIILLLFIFCGLYYFLDRPTATKSEKSTSKPQGKSQNIFLDKNGSADIFLEYNDQDQDNVTFEIVKYPSYGEIIGTNRNIVYKGYADYSGDDFFTYRVYDGEFYSDEAKISIKILNNNNEILKKLKLEKELNENKKRYQITKKRELVGKPKVIERGINTKIADSEPTPRRDEFLEVEANQPNLEEIADQIESEENDTYITQEINNYLEEYNLSRTEYQTKFNSLKNKIMNKLLRERNSRSEGSLEEYRTRVINQAMLEIGAEFVDRLDVRPETMDLKEEPTFEDNKPEEVYNKDEYVDEYNENQYEEPEVRDDYSSEEYNDNQYER